MHEKSRFPVAVTPNQQTMRLKHESVLRSTVRILIVCLLTATFMLSGMLAGCIGGNLENDFVYPDDVWYTSTNATIVEVWDDGELVETNYPVLSFDFNESNAPSPFVAYSVRGTHVDETVDASQTTVVEVEFKHDGFHALDLIADYQDTPDERGNDCLLYTSPSPRGRTRSRMPSSA